MYSPRSGKQLFYEKQMDTAFQDQLKLTDELDRAISREELQLHFQPIVDCGSQTVQGVEALVRWQHPQRGAILPGQFLPAAEQCGLILDIDEWVLQAACTQVLNHFGKRGTQCCLSTFQASTSTRQRTGRHGRRGT